MRAPAAITVNGGKGAAFIDILQSISKAALAIQACQGRKEGMGINNRTVHMGLGLDRKGTTVHVGAGDV